jgi:hypothetical protein
VTCADWMAAILYNGLGRYSDALVAAQQASEHRHVYASSWAWPELIEAAVRTGSSRIANDALDLLAEATPTGGTDLGLGMEARSRAGERGSSRRRTRGQGRVRAGRHCHYRTGARHISMAL